MTIHEKLFAYYTKIQSKEMQESIVGWKPIQMKNTRVAIRVNFKNDWLRVYQNMDKTVEWY